MIQPQIIYKYRNYTSENHQNLLFKNELFFSSPKEFNDPLDCRIPVKMDLLDSSEKIEEFANIILEKSLKLIKENNQNPEELKRDFINRLKTNLKGEQDFFNKVHFHFIDFRTGVISFSKEWNSTLMWSHYGDYHKGICYGLDANSLKNSGGYEFGGLIDYPIKFPEINPLKINDDETIYIQLGNKSKEWEYEKEYRIIKFFNNPIEPSDPLRKFYFKDGGIKEIILGTNFPDEKVKEIQEISLKKNIQLFKAIKKDWDFDIHRERIS